MMLDFDILQSQKSYGHDSYTCISSKVICSKVRLERW